MNYLDKINGELQGENNESQCTNDEEETVVDGRTGGLMGKPGTRISDPRFIHDMSLYFHDIVSFEPISCHFREDRKCKLFPEKTIGCVLLDGFLWKKFALSIFAVTHQSATDLLKPSSILTGTNLAF